MSADYYEILGVTSSATSEEIKKAYKKKAAEVHPDKLGGSDPTGEQFKKVSEAYNILNNSDSRENYDRRRKAASNSEGFTSKFAKVASAATSTAKKVVNDFVDENLFDTLDKILGRKKTPKNLEVTLKATLEDLYEGVEKKVVYKRYESCSSCKGKGAVSVEDIRVCNGCMGLGHTVSNLASFFTNEDCKKCHGTGKIILNKCSECEGKGECKYERDCTFKILKDLNFEPDRDGTLFAKDKLLLEGEGEYGGNLLVQIELKPHKFYEVKWPDLHIVLKVQFYQAVLGDYIEVESLKGPAVFKLSPGTEAGDVITLKNYGLRLPSQDDDSKYGDLYIKTDIEVPKRINKEQKELLQKYRDLDPSYKKARPKNK